MKVSKEAEFMLTEEEVCEILLHHFGKIDQLTEVPVDVTPRTTLYYNENEGTYKFTTTFETGSVVG